MAGGCSGRGGGVPVQRSHGSQIEWPGGFRAVLTGEASFQYDTQDGSGSKALYVSDIPALFYDDPYTMIDQFAVVDLDGDGQDEVVLRVIAAVLRQEEKPDAVWYDFPMDVSAVFP